MEEEKTALGLLFPPACRYGMYSSNHWAITQTLAGPWPRELDQPAERGRATWRASRSLVTGVVVQQTGSFFLAFAVAAAVVLTGAFMYAFVIGRIEPAVFGRRRKASNE